MSYESPYSPPEGYDAEADVTYILENIDVLWEQNQQRLRDKYGDNYTDHGSRTDKNWQPQPFASDDLLKAYVFSTHAEAEMERLGCTEEEARGALSARQNLLIRHIVNGAKSYVQEVGFDNIDARNGIGVLSMDYPFEEEEFYNLLVYRNTHVQDPFSYYLEKHKAGTEDTLQVLKEMGQVALNMEQERANARINTDNNKPIQLG